MNEKIKEVYLQNLNLNDINPRNCGFEECEPGHYFGPAIREHYLLHYVYKGLGTFQNKNNTYNLSAGDIFVIRPKERTIYTADKNKPWYYFWVGFESNLNLAEALKSDVIHSPACYPIFKSIFEKDTPTDIEFYICGKIYEILALIKSNFDGMQKNKTSQHVMAAKNYIETNYQQELNVSNIASNLGIDRSYFWKSFKNSTGKSPQQYIIDFRLEKAVELMAEYNLTPGEVAKEVGYPDIFSFSRMFKRKYGMPPSTFAK